MPERVSRMNDGITVKARVTVGRMKCASESDPVIGSQRKVTPKITISTRPSQKFGMACPNTARLSAARSSQVFARTAARMPKRDRDHDREHDRHEGELDGDADALADQF